MKDEQKQVLAGLGINIFNIDDRELYILMETINDELESREGIDNLEKELALAKRVRAERTKQETPMWKVEVQKPKQDDWEPVTKTEIKPRQSKKFLFAFSVDGQVVVNKEFLAQTLQDAESQAEEYLEQIKGEHKGFVFVKVLS